MGGLATSHVPAIGGAIAKGLQNDPYWKPFFDGFTMAHEWLDEMEPDTAVIFYNDHGLNFFLDAMPTFAVGAAREYQTGDEGWGIPVLKPFPGDADLSWHIINHLVADEFDITTCQSMTVDHALTIPYSLFWPGESRPVRIVPIAINTVQHPLPSARRCFALGRSVGRAAGMSAEQALDVAALQADVAQRPVAQPLQLAPRLGARLRGGRRGEPAQDGARAGAREFEQDVDERVAGVLAQAAVVQSSGAFHGGLPSSMSDRASVAAQRSRPMSARKQLSRRRPRAPRGYRIETGRVPRRHPARGAGA